MGSSPAARLESPAQGGVFFGPVHERAPEQYWPCTPGGAALFIGAAGYATTDVHDFSTSGSALATVSTELGSAGFGWLYSPSLMGEVRIRVTPESPETPLFVGIGSSAEVDRYLDGVGHTVITEFWEEKVRTVEGED